MYNQLVSKFFYFSFGASISRILSFLFYHSPFEPFYIFGPMVFALICYAFLKIEIKAIKDFNSIVYGLKFLLQLAFFEALIKSPKEDVLLDILAFIKAISVMDQFQLFQFKLELPQSLAIYIYAYIRTTTLNYGDFIQFEKLCILGACLFFEFYQTQYFKGVKQYLIENLAQVYKLESRWFKLLQNLKVGMAIFQGPSQDLTFANKALVQMLEINDGTNEQILSAMKQIIFRYKENNQKRELLFGEYLKLTILKAKQCLQDDQVLSSEIFKLKDKKKVIEVQFQMCSQEEGLVLMMVNDITSVRNLQKNKQIEKMKTVYFCSVAHDLKTPINSITATNEYMLQKFEREEALYKMFKVTKTSCQFLMQIIQDITDLSRIELKSFEIEKSWFSMREILNEVEEMMSFPFSMKNLELKFTILDPILDCNSKNIFSDPKRIKQILHNLIGNALKFTLKGSVQITVSLSNPLPSQISDQDLPQYQHQSDSIFLPFEEIKELDSQLEGGLAEERVLHFSVADTGVGIRDESKCQLFKLFGKVKEHGQVNKQGIGLGLTICKKLTELLQGKISVESEHMRGSTFAFSVKCQIRESGIAGFSVASPSWESELETCRLNCEQYLRTQCFGIFQKFD